MINAGTRHRPPSSGTPGALELGEAGECRRSRGGPLPRLPHRREIEHGDDVRRRVLLQPRQLGVRESRRLVGAFPPRRRRRNGGGRPHRPEVHRRRTTDRNRDTTGRPELADRCEHVRADAPAGGDPSAASRSRTTTARSVSPASPTAQHAPCARPVAPLTQSLKTLASTTPTTFSTTHSQAASYSFRSPGSSRNLDPAKERSDTSAGRIELRKARRQIAANWQALYKRAFRSCVKREEGQGGRRSATPLFLWLLDVEGDDSGGGLAGQFDRHVDF